ncbi:MAG: hypothetical protein IK151_01780 [Erysipelotrichaceae bacterium]|nr:hypothetical protein [Erysipelotrichaceae bacterium]
MLFTKVPAYLIDSENVGSTWTYLLKGDEKFELYICVTENAKSLNFSLLRELTEERRHKINIIECEPGKNSLDFYLSSYLGYLIGKNRHSSYTIVSQDTGYDHVIEYWKSQGYDVQRINTKPEKEKKHRRIKTVKKQAEEKPVAKPDSEIRVIKKKEIKEDEKQSFPQKSVSSPKVKSVKKKTVSAPAAVKSEGHQELLKRVLKDLEDNEIEKIKTYLDKVPEEKREDKNYIYRGLVRKFKREKGLEIYTQIKKELANYYRLSEEKKQ